MTLSRFSIVVAFLLIAAGLGGCSTIHKQALIGNTNTLSVDAKQRLFISGRDGVCAEPSPDAIVARAAALSGGLSGTQSRQGSLAAAASEAAASIGLRTQSIQILRDGYYRICEAYINGAIKRESYEKIISQVDVFIAVALAIDTLGGSVRAPAVILQQTANANQTDDDNPSVGITPSSSFESSNLSRADLEKLSANSAAIVAIIEKYIDYRKLVLRERLNDF